MTLMTVAEAKDIVGKSGFSTDRMQVLLDNSENEIVSVAGYPHSGSHVHVRHMTGVGRDFPLPPTITSVSQVRELRSGTWETLDTDRYLLVGHTLRKVGGYWQGMVEVTGTLADETVRRKQVQAQLLALDIVDYTATGEEVGSYQADYRDRLAERKRILQNLQVDMQWV